MVSRPPFQYDSCTCMLGDSSADYCGNFADLFSGCSRPLLAESPQIPSMTSRNKRRLREDEDEPNYKPWENLVPTTGYSETLSSNRRRIIWQEIVVLTPESPERPSTRRCVTDGEPHTNDLDVLDQQDWQTVDVDIPPPSSAQAQSRKWRNIYYQSEVRKAYFNNSHSH